MQALATLPDLDPTTMKPQCVDLLKELWLQPLPQSVRAALHEADDIPIQVLIKKADNLINAAKASHIPDAVFSASAEDLPDTNAAKSSLHKWPPNNQARNHNPGAHSQQMTHGLCYFHYKFGAGAHTCIPRCQWPKNV